MKAIVAVLLMLWTASAPGFAAPQQSQQPRLAEGRIVAWHALDGGAAGTMSVWVWLPPGYDQARGQRFPVLYMHDGQNLFDRRLTKFNQEWGMDEAIPRMARQGDLRRWIVVGVESPKARYTSLFPEKMLPFLGPKLRRRVADLDSGDPKAPFAGGAYLRFLTGVVKPRVDRSFRTLTGREDTAVMGSSMGGLMAFYAMAEYPHIFGQAAAVSMHLALASSSEKGVDHNAAAASVADAFRRYLAASKLRPGANRLYIDHGTATLDGSYAPYSDAVVPMFRAAGWDERFLTFRTFAGAEHNETAWSQRVDIPLAFLDSRDP